MSGGHVDQNQSGIIAVVDDDPAVLDSLQFLLEVGMGHNVRIYPSAAAFLQDESVTPACLVLDQHMPAMTGLELAGQLRRSGARIPILLLSGSLTPDITARAMELGIDAVLDKPVNENDLFRFVNSHASQTATVANSSSEV